MSLRAGATPLSTRAVTVGLTVTLRLGVAGLTTTDTAAGFTFSASVAVAGERDNALGAGDNKVAASPLVNRSKSPICYRLILVIRKTEGHFVTHPSEPDVLMQILYTVVVVVVSNHCFPMFVQPGSVGLTALASASVPVTVGIVTTAPVAAIRNDRTPVS